MGRWQKLIDQILCGHNDANVSFNDLCSLLERLGFVRRTRGSHQVFRKPGVLELINLQEDGSKAKPYQVRQVRDIIICYHLSDKG